jgi:Uncharacterised nucleotidyltransferase
LSHRPANLQTMTCAKGCTKTCWYAFRRLFRCHHMRDAEFDLLLAACSTQLEDRPLDARPIGISWDRFFALANRHRVQALCWKSLGRLADQMPNEIAAALQEQSRGIVLGNLRACAECERIREGFEAADVPLLFLKGLTLGALAYRQPYLKMGMDIDLLVEPDRVIDAVHLLQSAGYVAVIPPGADETAIARWHLRRKESVWHRAEGNFQVDLHTRVADRPDVLPGLTAASPSQFVQVASGINLPTLTSDDLIAYLCVHGASSAWFRLKWITDLAAVLRRLGATEIERLHDHSQQLGAGRAAGQALLLADRLYSIGLGETLRKQLEADPVTCWMVRLAERQLFNSSEPTERFLGTATIHLSQLGLRPGWRFKASEAARQVRDMLATGAI